MPQLTANERAIKSAIAGAAAVYSIARHDRLYLDVHGKGYAAWRLRYRPRPKASQRWYTIAKDANAVGFDEVALKAKEILAALDLHAIDPHDAKPEASSGERSVKDCFLVWLDHTGKRRKKTLAPRTRAGYENLFKLHIEPHLGKIAIARLDRRAILRALDTVRANTSDAEKKQRGVTATKALKLVSSLCEWTLDQSWIASNPCRDIEDPVPVKNPDGKQARPPTDIELRQLWTEAPGSSRRRKRGSSRWPS